MKKKLFLTLKFKISIIVLLTLIISIGILNYYDLKYRSILEDSVSKENISILSSSIENVLTAPMVEGKIELVQKIITNISIKNEIVNFKIVSDVGKIVSSSVKEEIGKKVEMEIKEAIGEILKSNKKEPYFKKEKTSFFYVKSITNNHRCYSCHNPEKKINGFLYIKFNFNRIKKITEEDTERMVLISLVILILTFLFLRIAFKKYINNPIVSILKYMREIEKGNFKVRANFRGNDEISQLGEKFNHMAERVEEIYAEKERIHSEEMRYAEHLASLGELGAGLAHEIKNPLTGIKGALETIIEENPKKENLRDILNAVLSQIDRINEVIKEFLIYAKPKQPQLVMSNMCRIVKNAIKIVEFYYFNKKIEFNSLCPVNLPNQYLDEDQVQQVLVNLLMNSIESIENEGKISLILNVLNKKGIEIKIIDNGRGIPKENMPLVFKPFFTTKPRGTGLGLSVCKRIIENHKGRISIESEEGQGTIVSIFFPFIKNLEI
ncbi:MAG: ATP-binding protein [Acidobacteriota bacterium]